MAGARVPRGTVRALLARSMRYPRSMHKCIAVSQMQADTAADPPARQHRPPLFAAPGPFSRLPSPLVPCIALSNTPNRSAMGRKGLEGFPRESARLPDDASENRCVASVGAFEEEATRRETLLEI